jgi:hypothetical protein
MISRVTYIFTYSPVGWLICVVVCRSEPSSFSSIMMVAVAGRSRLPVTKDDPPSVVDDTPTFAYLQETNVR